MRTQRLLRRKAASDYLREIHGLERAPSTLAKLAVIGGGPVFRRAGRVPLYSPEDLDEWATSKLGPRMHSTSVAASVKHSVSDTAATAQVKHRTQASAGRSVSTG